MPPRLLPPRLFRKPPSPGGPTRRSTRRSEPRLEALESRVVLYSASGNAWPNPALITLSFMPDGTNFGGKTSNLDATLKARFGSTANWQNVVIKAAQTWAAQTNINFAVVPDNGASEGSGSHQQGDPGFGDIRIGGYNFNSSSLAQAFMPPPVNNYSIAGDVAFNTGQSFNSGSTYDLFTVATHEIGHALGLYHGGIASAEMYSSYNGVKNALTADDIAGIQSIYGGARKVDAFDSGGGDDSVSTAVDLTSRLDPEAMSAVVTGLDLTTSGDKDYLVFTAPGSESGTMTVTVQSQGLSLLSPAAAILNSGSHVLSSASGRDQHGATLTLTTTGVQSGQKYYVSVSGTDSTALSTGAYAVTVNFGAGAQPTVPLPNTTRANGSPLSSGGGQAVKVNLESQVNTTTAGNQANWLNASHYTAIDANGNYVIAWQSAGQDGGGWGVYAQRFDVNGVKVGGEFLVNSTTAGDQTSPTVAMDAGGDFVIAWTSSGKKDSDVYAQRYNNQGTAQGGEFRVNSTTAGDQQYPDVAMDRLGNFTVTWTSSGQDGGGLGVYAQRYTALGIPLGFETRVNSTTAGDQQTSRIGMDSVGDSVITWTSSGQDGGGLGVYAQRFNPLGVAAGGEFRVNSTTAGDQSYSSVGLDALGDFTIAWQSYGQDGDGWGVYAQRYNALGLPQGGEFRVNSTTAGDQAFPSVSTDNGGDALISWSSNSTPSSSPASFAKTSTYWNTFGKQYTSSGQPLGNEFQLNSSTGADQYFPSVAMDSQGHVVVAWTGGSALDSIGVLAQQLNISFSGESVDAFFAEGDPNDPDQAHPAATDPVTVTRPPTTPQAERGARDSQALSPGRVDLVLNDPGDLFSRAGSTRAEHAAATSPHAAHHSHRPTHAHKGVGAAKTGPSAGRHAHPDPLRTPDHPTRRGHRHRA